jgi:hypothetical protein
MQRYRYPYRWEATLQAAGRQRHRPSVSSHLLVTSVAPPKELQQTQGRFLNSHTFRRAVFQPITILYLCWGFLTVSVSLVMTHFGNSTVVAFGASVRCLSHTSSLACLRPARPRLIRRTCCYLRSRCKRRQNSVVRSAAASEVGTDVSVPTAARSRIRAYPELFSSPGVTLDRVWSEPPVYVARNILTAEVKC